MYKEILFDLDGTLIDSGLGITNSVIYALGKLGVEAPGREELYKFVGPPLGESFEKYFGLDDEQVRAALAYYREYYAERGIYENKVYIGVEDMLRTLDGRGRRLTLATSKPTVYAEKILKYYGFDRYFAFAAGSNLDRTRSKKSEVIEFALNSVGISDKKSAVMVGDREHDIRGAAEAGIDSAGVLYGYGSLCELTEAGATYIAASAAEVAELLR